jgi:O-methyltransferase involved in polyketide biosynthesis
MRHLGYWAWDWTRGRARYGPIRRKNTLPTVRGRLFHVSLIPVHFARKRLEDSLRSHSYSPSQKGSFGEGVKEYLSETGVRTIFESLAV